MLGRGATQEGANGIFSKRKLIYGYVFVQSRKQSCLAQILLSTGSEYPDRYPMTVTQFPSQTPHCNIILHQHSQERVLSPCHGEVAVNQY